MDTPEILWIVVCFVCALFAIAKIEMLSLAETLAGAAIVGGGMLALWALFSLLFSL